MNPTSAPDDRTATLDSAAANGTLGVHFPQEGYLAERDHNENSLVLRIGFGGSSFLFTGDAGPIAGSSRWTNTGPRSDPRP